MPRTPSNAELVEQLDHATRQLRQAKLELVASLAGIKALSAELTAEAPQPPPKLRLVKG